MTRLISSLALRALAILGCLVANLASAQQPPAKLPVIGWLSPASAQTLPEKLLRDQLAKQGLVEGKTMRLIIRIAEGKVERLPGLAEELVREGVAVIMASGEQAARAAQAATKTLPIVTGGDDLVGSGLAASLSRPGGNITGVSILATELDAKKLEVMKELLPGTKRLGVLNDPETSGPGRPKAIADAARQLGVDLISVDVRGEADLEPAFRAFKAGGVQGVNIVASAMLTNLRPRLGALSHQYKIPAICQWREMVQAGCLASYGVTFTELYELYAGQIARVLNGAKPADIPVLQPRRFELVINLKTAKALGIAIPQSVLLRADEVIQ